MILFSFSFKVNLRPDSISRGEQTSASPEINRREMIRASKIKGSFPP